MADALRTGLSGLLAFQRAIATTSHNIANANTEGYSRQRVELTPHPPEAMGFGYLGRGVAVTDVQRIQDEFSQTRLLQTASEQARSSTYHSLISRIDSLLSEESASLSPAMSQFFNAIEDLNNDPASLASREAMLSAANNLTGRFNTIQGQFDDLDSEVNRRLSSSVTEINSLATNIAKLNNDIMGATAHTGGNPPNDLLDQRDNLLNELSEYTSINTVVEANGAMSVFMGNGLSLVVGTHAEQLAITQDPESSEINQVGFQTATGVRIISNQLTGGSIGGLMDFRRETLDPARNELGRVAMVLADKFNQQHQQGIDLNGETGNDFFTQPEITSLPNKRNTGTAVADVSLTDIRSLTASDYRLDYDGSQYTVTRLSDNTNISGGVPLEIDGMEITITGAVSAGDTFLIRPTSGAAGDISLSNIDVRSIAAAALLTSSANLTNTGVATISSPQVIINNSAIGETAEIRFNNPPTTFDIINASDGSLRNSNIAFVEGGNIENSGWQVQINGSPQAGDTFRIETASASSTNNLNGQALSDIQNLTLIGGQSSLHEGYASLVGKVGSDTRQADLNTQTMDRLLGRAQETRDSVSGVNLDEEAINLTRYQQAYQAAAQVISIADSMFQTLIGAVRR